MAVHILNDKFNKDNIIFRLGSLPARIKLSPDLLSIELQ